jgi:hypothetical protein
MLPISNSENPPAQIRVFIEQDRENPLMALGTFPINFQIIFLYSKLEDVSPSGVKENLLKSAPVNPRQQMH